MCVYRNRERERADLQGKMNRLQGSAQWALLSMVAPAQEQTAAMRTTGKTHMAACISWPIWRRREKRRQQCVVLFCPTASWRLLWYIIIWTLKLQLESWAQGCSSDVVCCIQCGYANGRSDISNGVAMVGSVVSFQNVAKMLRFRLLSLVANSSM